MTLYQQFICSSLDTAGIGLDTGAGSDALICTPLHATIIGWAADQGLHFCFTDRFGETVFAVDPNASDEFRIQPIAQDFRAFLGLILACRGTARLTETGINSKSGFAQAIKNTTLSNRQQSILRAIENGYQPTKIEDPWQYIQNLQADFDYAAIPLHPDYDAHYGCRPGPACWEVTFGSSFTTGGTGKPGKEIPLGKSFLRGSEQWHFPAVYICSQGIVMDCFAAIDPVELSKFHGKWDSAGDLTWDQELRRDQEDPLQLHVQPHIYIDGKPLRNCTVHQQNWIIGADNHPSLSRVLRQYGLDPQQNWIMIRLNAPRKGKKKSIKELRLTLESLYITVPGIQFTDPAPGSRYSFYHSGLGTNHTLTVHGCSCEELDPNFLWNLPSHHQIISYSLEPEIDDIWVCLRDRENSDPVLPFPGECDSISVPNSMLPAPSVSGLHAAASALRYQKAASVTWQMLLRIKKQPDCSWLLIP